VAVGTVKSRLHRGRAALAARLGDYRDDADPLAPDPARAIAEPAPAAGSTEVTHA
jgi:RNA polymerase sigma-70 factor (ECF subfamily)